MRLYSILPIFLFTVLLVNAQGNPLVSKDSLAQQNWVDEQYDKMSLDEKFGQLLSELFVRDTGYWDLEGVGEV